VRFPWHDAVAEFRCEPERWFAEFLKATEPDGRQSAG
jgi:hypothetical protein